MKIFSNGTYREMTQQELAEYEALTALPSEQNNDYEDRITAIEIQLGNIEEALNHIIEIQEALMGGNEQ